MPFAMLTAESVSWREKPPRLMLLRAVAAVPLLAAALLAVRQWRDAGRRVRAPWEERAAFSARTLTSSAMEKLTALEERESVSLPFFENGDPLELKPPRTDEERQAARRAEEALAVLRLDNEPADTALALKLAAANRDTVTETGLPALPLLWYAAASRRRAPLPVELWTKELAAAVLARPSVLSGRLLEQAMAFLPGPAPEPEAGSGQGSGLVRSTGFAVLDAARRRWREMQSLMDSLAPVTGMPHRTGERFWTPDGAWLAMAVASTDEGGNDGGGLGNYHAVRREQVEAQVIHSLNPPDSRLIQHVTVAGKSWPEPPESRHSESALPGRAVAAALIGTGEEFAVSASESLGGTGGVTVQVRLRDASALREELAAERRTLLVLPLLAAVSGLGGWLTLERALRRQQRLNRLKTDFVSSVSHELRAPVAGIRLLAERMAAGRADAEQTLSYSRMIEREARRVGALVENVLDFARIENGRKAWRLEDCDPVPAVCGAVETMQPLAAARAVALSCEAPAENTLRLKADAEALRQAVVNLVDNAVKFSLSGAGVSVRVAAEAGAVAIRVRDHGCGIPDHELPCIFDRFYRGGNELRRETPGAGIGLSLVRHIAGVHGGTVTVKTQPGHGSEFTLRIPLTPPPGMEAGGRREPS